MSTERDLVRRFTGLVVESLTVTGGVGGAVACRGCADADRPPEDGVPALGIGDEVTVALSCYEDHSWEIQGVYCGAHGVASVPDAMAVRAETQAVVDAVLEAAGYHSPDGTVYPEALTLGAVRVRDVSSTADGYRLGR